MKQRVLITALFSLLSSQAFANSIDVSQVASGDRWFEVEMIIFQRQPTDNSIEHFNLDDPLVAPARYFDLLQSYYQPDITPLLRQLALCQPPASAEPMDEALPVATPPKLAGLNVDALSHTAQSINQQDLSLQNQTDVAIDISHYIEVLQPQPSTALCIHEPQPPLWQQPLFAITQWITDTPLPNPLARQPTASAAHQIVPYLISRDALQLSSVAQQLQQQTGIDVLLHTGFRQAPVTDRRSIASRWYAGLDLQPPQHSSDTAMVATEGSLSLRPDVLLQQIEQRYQAITQDMQQGNPLQLAQLSAANQLPDEAKPQKEHIPLWQLDGFVRVHLDHYLFINTDLILRELGAEETVQQQRIQLSRRVISGEMHYLDHPRLGIVLQIRRYTPPTDLTERSNDNQ